jgi:choline/glycine/proline betaine transport protein
LGSIATRVFFPAAAIILAFVIFAMAVPDTANDWLLEVQGQIVGKLGWYYVILVTGFVVFALWAGLGRFGDIKLGPDDEDPEFGIGSWFAMLFAAGMGIGLVFFGVAEPLSHFAGTPANADGTPSNVVGVTDDVNGSLVQTFLHWGLHPWAIYVVVGLAVAFTVHRKGRPVSIRWTLEPILGDRVKGWAGDAIDVAAIVATVFGVATSLGIGVTQIAAGLEFLDVLSDPGTLAKVFLIGLITLIAVVSVVTGVNKGIKWLSNLNMGLAAGLLIFVAVAGPTLFLLRGLVQSIGIYLQNVLQMSFRTTALEGSAGEVWQGWWTIFYWGWWISWAPFVGIFIARISRGRTVRQFVAGVLLVPTAVTFLWFTVFGGAAIRKDDPLPDELLDSSGNVIPEVSLFTTLGGLPIGTLLVAIAVVLIGVFFITSSDSGSLVVDMLASGGDLNPPAWSRVFWGVSEGAVAAALLIVGGDDGLFALRYAAIIIALPFSVVMLGMVISMVRALRRERQMQLRVQRRMQREELAAELSHSFNDGGD